FRYDFIRENHEKEINFSFKFVSQEGKDKKKPHFKGLNLHFELNTIYSYITEEDIISYSSFFLKQIICPADRFPAFDCSPASCALTMSCTT
ncbi:hypothetical protein MKC93_02485, partial [[Clostridium] innocuum]|nr:hypothetical protein [[Clostridium] innocuum]